MHYGVAADPCRGRDPNRKGTNGDHHPARIQHGTEGAAVQVDRSAQFVISGNNSRHNSDEGRGEIQKEPKTFAEQYEHATLAVAWSFRSIEGKAEVRPGCFGALYVYGSLK